MNYVSFLKSIILILMNIMCGINKFMRIKHTALIRACADDTCFNPGLRFSAPGAFTLRGVAPLIT